MTHGYAFMCTNKNNDLRILIKKAYGADKLSLFAYYLSYKLRTVNYMENDR